MPAGRPTKLTPAISESICKAIRSAAPMHWAFRYAGVHDQTMRNWRAAATRGQAKKPREQSQHERKCIAFFGAVEQAEADAFMLLSGTIMAGSQKSKVVRTTTTTKGDGDTREITTLVEEREIAGDWRAAAHLAARRFPHEMGDRLQIEGTEDGAPIRTVTNDETWDELEAYRRQRALKRGEDVAPARPAAANGHVG